MSTSLIIECSTPQATIALAKDELVVMQREFTSDRNHNALLFKPLQELLAGTKDIKRILVGSGPGSYSGTRVGIAAAQGIGLALGCPVIAVPSILAVPTVHGADDGKGCLAIGDARRGSYWTAIIKHEDLIQEPQLCDLESLAGAITAAAEQNMPVFSFEEAERFPLSEPQQSLIRLERPAADLLWTAWLEASTEQQAAWQSQIAQPIYLKPPHITVGKRPRLVE